MTALGLLIFLSGLTLRTMVARHPHSGQGKPPMFGDYEAQRHWQEITVNLPVNEWYFNSTTNDLNYWGLDYPPLTAYHSWLLGKVAEHIDASYIALGSSRGLEDVYHKLFMRATVIVSDVLVYAPAVFIFSWAALANKRNNNPYICSALMILYPGLILIDHGHFQYNGVSLGLMILAVASLLRDKDCLGSILFVAALSYKQMELYHALPFFFYLLGKSLFHQPSFTAAIVKLVLIAATVVGSFIIIWLPFIGSLDQFLQVLHRIFPLARGVFEDKVANVWCAVNVVIKIKEMYDVPTLAAGCLASTAIAALPSNILLFLQPSKPQFVLALINTSLAFFLFSFQVHEKSILLVAVPVLMVLGGFPDIHRRYTPLFCVCLLTATTASMYPLLLKDELAIPTLALSAFFLIVCHYFELFEPVRHSPSTVTPKGTRQSSTPIPLDKKQVSMFWYDWLVFTLVALYLIGYVILCLCHQMVEPPPKYPHLWPLMISVYSALLFLISAIYFNFFQFSLYREVRRLQQSTVTQSKKKN